MELLPAAPEGDRPRRLVVAVPSAQACDDPGRPCETSDGMVILLPLGAAFKRRAECRESVDLGFGECIGRRHVIGAVATLGQLDVDAGRFRRHRGELHQPVCRGDLAVLQLQSLRFHHPEQLLDDPATLVPSDNFPCRRRVSDRMRGQQPPMQRFVPLPVDRLPAHRPAAAVRWAAGCGRVRPAGDRSPPRRTAVLPPRCAWDARVHGTAVRSCAAPPLGTLPRRRTACRRQPAGGPSSPGPACGSLRRAPIAQLG